VQAGIGADALPPVLEIMDSPMKTKTITLSCGKLTTGVTVKPWTGIFMLRNSSSPETYFQAAFRVQSPWSIKNPDSTSPNQEQIIKEECYVFDFAPDRALRQIAEYSCRLNVDESNIEKKVEEFIHFLPVLAYDGSSMKQIDAGRGAGHGHERHHGDVTGQAVGKRVAGERGQWHVATAHGQQGRDGCVDEHRRFPQFE
jgi:hypothetical protein